MKVERGDFVEHSWDEHYAVIVDVDTLPYGMGFTYKAVNTAGVVEHFGDANLTADFGMTRSDHHAWAPGQQAEYDSLSAHGRSLYDQIRTRVPVGHQQALEMAREHTPGKASK